ncbi:hypothetical protein F5X98DRAFT_380485 [Xylaria grammica]|nr:hypothetical protein F5X98DRAFT_380485 [Xylaria grammica]
MKLSHLPLMIAAIPAAIADFWLVYQRRRSQIGRVEFTSYGTSITHDVPEWTCEHDAFTHRIFPDRQNASGDNYGVEFRPSWTLTGPLWHDPLLSLTMNLYPSPLGLQTISHRNDYTMRNIDNEISGQCHLNRTHILDLDCWFRHPDSRIKEFQVSINGSSMFFCESDLEMKEDGYSWDPFLQGSDDLPLVHRPWIPIIPPKGQEY